MSDMSRREVASLRAEIRDLTNYLEGLPEELRRGGAFLSYEERLASLRKELAHAEQRDLKLSAGR